MAAVRVWDVDYDERLRVPLRWWVQGTMLVASVWLASVVALPTWAVWTVSAVAAALVTALFLGYGGARVQVDGCTFLAGRAHIDVGLLGEATPLDADAARRQAGVDADARAYLLLRPYLKQAVRVDLRDPADPTPYWLVSTRRPEELARAVTEAAGRLAPGHLTKED